MKITQRAESQIRRRVCFACLGFFTPLSAFSQTISVEIYQYVGRYGSIVSYTRQHGILSSNGSFKPVGPPMPEGFLTGSQEAGRADKLVGKFVSRERDFGPKQADAFSRGDRYSLPNSMSSRFEVQIAQHPIPSSENGKDPLEGVIQTRQDQDSWITGLQKELTATEKAQGMDSLAAKELQQGIDDARRVHLLPEISNDSADDAADKEIDAIANQETAKLDEQHAAHDIKIQASIKAAQQQEDHQQRLNEDALQNARKAQSAAWQKFQAKLATGLVNAAATEVKNARPSVPQGGTWVRLRTKFSSNGTFVQAQEATYKQADVAIYESGLRARNPAYQITFQTIWTSDNPNGPGGASTSNGAAGVNGAGVQIGPVGQPTNADQNNASILAPSYADTDTPPANSKTPAASNAQVPSAAPADERPPQGNPALDELTKEEIDDALTTLDEQISELEKSRADGTSMGEAESRAIDQLKAARAALQQEKASGKNPTRSDSDLPPDQTPRRWNWTGANGSVQTYEFSDHDTGHTDVGFVPDFPVDPQKMPPGWSSDPDTGCIYRQLSSTEIQQRVQTKADWKAGGGSLTHQTPYSPNDAYNEFKAAYKP